MSNCELCGSETDSTNKIKLEGAQLTVCDSCSDMGHDVGASRQKRGSSSGNKKVSKTYSKDSSVLVSNYGEKIKKAREAEGLTQKELAENMNEKESRLSKIEKQQLKPDEALSKKLKRELGLELYTNSEVSNYDHDRSIEEKEATLGDVADVKE